MSIGTEPKPRLSPAARRAVRYLRSPAGMAWTRQRIGMTGHLAHHNGGGAFAEVIPDSQGCQARASWPDPFLTESLDYLDEMARAEAEDDCA